MRTVIFFALLVFSMTYSVFSATAPDPGDSILVAYQINAVAEQAFAATSGAPAAFWADWETEGNDIAALNKVENGSGTITNDDDASMVVKAAYGEDGVYLFAEITDDNFRSGDVLRFFFDTEPSNWVQTWYETTGSFHLEHECFISNSGSYFEIPCGNTTPSEIKSVFVQPDYQNGGSYLKDSLLSVSNLAVNFDGMKLKMLEINAQKRFVEFYLPYSYFSNYNMGGGLYPLPLKGDLIAFCPQYIDKDGTNSGELSLNKGTDPLNCTRTPYNDNCFPWGDIEIGPIWKTGETSIKCCNPYKKFQTANQTMLPDNFYRLDGRQLSQFNFIGLKVAKYQKAMQLLQK